jgi:ATP-dependent DNA helicase RecG
LRKEFTISSRGTNILANPIEYLKGVGPQRAELLQKELGIFTFKDLLEHFPYRHIDRTKVSLIREINPGTDFIQIAGRITSVGIMGEKRAKRLVAEIRDASGTLELIWFQGITWIEKMLTIGSTYRVFGKVSFFQSTAQMTHPEIEPVTEEANTGRNFLEPVYSTTEKLKARGLGARQIAKLTQSLFMHLSEKGTSGKPA